MSKKQKCAMVTWLVIGILWTVFIFCRSAKTGEESSMESGRLAELLQWLLGRFPISERFVRKLAHFGEYLILALPMTSAAILAQVRWLPCAAWGYTLAVAVCDEFIVQALTPGRGPSIFDVLIDGAGALVGTAVVLGLFYWNQNRRQKRDR